MEALNWLIEILLIVCLVVATNIEADVQVVIMIATVYLAAVIREVRR